MVLTVPAVNKNSLMEEERLKPSQPGANGETLCAGKHPHCLGLLAEVDFGLNALQIPVNIGECSPEPERRRGTLDAPHSLLYSQPECS